MGMKKIHVVQTQWSYKEQAGQISSISRMACQMARKYTTPTG